MKRLVQATIAAAAVLVTACGPAPAPPRAASQRPSAVPLPPTPSRSILPSVVVRDVAGGPDVDVASLVPATQPLLLWFYAPH